MIERKIVNVQKRVQTNVCTYNATLRLHAVVPLRKIATFILRLFISYYCLTMTYQEVYRVYSRGIQGKWVLYNLMWDLFSNFTHPLVSQLSNYYFAYYRAREDRSPTHTPLIPAVDPSAYLPIYHVKVKKCLVDHHKPLGIHNRWVPVN